jgi:Fe-S-cluster containining protein
MKLNVISEADRSSAKAVWYADGLDFTCTQCGNCCTGGPGFVWLEKSEIVALAEYQEITPEEMVERYCRRIAGKFSLKEIRHPGRGEFDCIFIKEILVNAAPGAGKVEQTRRVCSVYPVRPLQCRTWPFWPENLASKKAWKMAGKKCHGMDQGRHFDRPSIEAIRDAAKWPEDPPSSEADAAENQSMR